MAFVHNLPRAARLVVSCVVVSAVLTACGGASSSSRATVTEPQWVALVDRLCRTLIRPLPAGSLDAKVVGGRTAADARALDAFHTQIADLMVRPPNVRIARFRHAVARIAGTLDAVAAGARRS